MPKSAAAYKKTETPNFGLGILVILLVVVLTVFLLPKVSRALVLTALSRTSGLSVSAEDFDLSLTQPQFALKEIQFSNPPGFPAGALAKIGNAQVRYFLPSIIQGRLEIKKAKIDFKEFRLIRNYSGTLNLPRAAQAPGAGDTIGELVLNLGTVTYTDLSQSQPIQQNYEIGLTNAIYRNVKGIPGVMEIVKWEVLKRSGVEERINLPPVTEIKPTVSAAPAEGTTPEAVPPTSATAPSSKQG